MLVWSQHRDYDRNTASPVHESRLTVGGATQALWPLSVVMAKAFTNVYKSVHH